MGGSQEVKWLLQSGSTLNELLHWFKEKVDNFQIMLLEYVTFNGRIVNTCMIDCNCKGDFRKPCRNYLVDENCRDCMGNTLVCKLHQTL